jgi:hypothetical membrane protein
MMMMMLMMLMMMMMVFTMVMTRDGHVSVDEMMSIRLIMSIKLMRTTFASVSAQMDDDGDSDRSS